MAAIIATPSNCTRQEQKIMNAIMSLNEASANGAILERSNLVSFYAEYQIIKTPDGTSAFVGRVVLPLDNPSQIATGAKPWIMAQDLPGTATISAYYSSN